MKNDLRVRYTREMIQRVYLELLQTKPMDKITVTEVCERAQINRGTFYKHYEDCFDLTARIEDEALQRFDAVLDSNKNHNGQPILLTILQTLRANRNLFDGLTRQQDNNHFVQKIAARCFQHQALWRSEARTDRWEHEPQRTIAYAFLAGGCSGAIESWLQRSMPEPPEQIAAEINALIQALHRGLS